MALGTSRDITPTAVGDAANMGKVEVSRAVSRLVTAGLVSNKKSPHDRREKLLRLTSKGTRTLEAITKESASFQRKLLAGLAPREAAAFRSTLEKLEAAAVSGE
jgi:DNA-binding MarR family transcriptional regulator